MGTVGKSIQGNGYRALTLTERTVTLAVADGPDFGGRGDVIGSPRDAARIAGAIIGTRAAESVLVLMLDSRHRVTGYAEVARGATNAARLTGADVFRPALLSGAVAVIVAHNHPSGDASPSSADRMVTATLRAAGELLGIAVLDHVIVTVSRTEHYSFADAGAIGGGALTAADGDAPAYAPDLAPDLAADLAQCETRLESAERSLAALDSMHEIRTSRVDAFGGETMGATLGGYSPAHVLGLDPDSESDVKVARERIGALRADHAAALRDVKAFRAERRAIVAEIARATGRAPRGWARVAGSQEFEPVHTFRAAVPALAEPVAAAVAYVPEWPPIEAYADVDAAPVARPVAPVAVVARPIVPAYVAEPVAAVTLAPFVLAPRKPGGRRAWRLAVTVARTYWAAVARVVAWSESDSNAEPIGATFEFRGLAMADGDAPEYGLAAGMREATRARRIVAAVDALAELDSACWFDQATAFSCSEADTLAELFRAAGHDGLAEQFIAEHARGDEDGDSVEHLAIAAAEDAARMGDGDAPRYRSPNLGALLAEGKRREAARIDRGRPEPGKQYRLTGGPGVAAISNGSTWAESEVTAEPVAEPVAVTWETSE
ncbi:MAG TPA: JAB domain-containing protein, partial [Thermomicrobiaceae bacterium]|nr:JAB domain-containing protein [Thermomicrobiaceae bacterium]